ncbi:hypothetical protein INR49_028692 [Caranx melampygus]|nr:hypothetical protein INR49_028692 [Caranx melampygus]
MCVAGAMSLRCLILLFCLGLAAAKLTGETEISVDEGHDWDIFEINKAAGLDLLEGDIKQEETFSRNIILGDKYRWPTTIPYYLEKSLDMNAKGVILKAFDQYRLKTCIDFTPWKGEKNYISVFKGSGCYSYVGNQHAGKQQLSIGENCDDLGTVVHEFLHALGFWHEQSRVDRDDYVNIMWDRIEPEEKHNFNIHSDTSALGVPYDYSSVMHYDKIAFSKGSEPTIVTKMPQFNDVIGQNIGFSAGDLTKLNRLYNCTRSSTFVDSCNFEEENICGMIQGPGKAKWQRRSCCLQFFLYNSGAADDVLRIWVREYDMANPCGKLRLIKTISGGPIGSWELHNVDLKVKQKARVVFEGVRGKGRSKGGLSLDDINLSSTKCPKHVWHIRKITGLMATIPAGSQLFSPRFLSRAGYSFQISMFPNGRRQYPGYVALYFHLTSGPNDRRLKWPCPWHQVTMALMDQQSDIRQQMNMHHMVTTDPNQLDGTEYFWDNPKKVGSKVTEADGSYYYRGPGYGYSNFIIHSRLRSRKFIKGDDAFFLFTLEDISSLLGPQPHSADHDAAHLMRAGDQVAPQGEANNPPAVNTWRMRRRRQRESDKVAIIRDMPGFMEEQRPLTKQ